MEEVSLLLRSPIFAGGTLQMDCIPYSWLLGSIAILLSLRRTFVVLLGFEEGGRR